MSFKKTVLLLCLMLIAALRMSAQAAGYVPWDELTQDWWIDFFDGDDPNMYPVNAADSNDINAAYPVSFLQKGGGNKARGMNALKFKHTGLMEGRLVSKDKAGTFKVVNTGDSKFFTDILLAIAIDADNLQGDFSMTLNLAGQAPYVIDANDFAYYDNPYGRPSGFYSATNPDGEPISYAFDAAMVCVYGVSGLDVLEPTDPLHPEYVNEMTIEYSFNDIPAPVVFSIYGYVATDPIPTIYHTNRAFIDTNNPSENISTFAVTVQADLNHDLQVDLADLSMMTEQWLIGVN